MSILIKVVLGVGAFLLIVGSICVTIVALYPPKECKGDGKASKSDDKCEAIENA